MWSQNCYLQTVICSFIYKMWNLYSTWISTTKPLEEAGASSSKCFDTTILFIFHHISRISNLQKTLLVRDHPFGCCLPSCLQSVVQALIYLHFSFFEAKEKRGWTLNSAGYLLGPRKSSTLSRTIQNSEVPSCKTFCLLCATHFSDNYTEPAKTECLFRYLLRAYYRAELP